MIILMNREAKKNDIDLVLETLEKQNYIPFYIKNENAISSIETPKSVDLSLDLIKNLPGIDKIFDFGIGNRLRLVN